MSNKNLNKISGHFDTGTDEYDGPNYDFELKDFSVKSDGSDVEILFDGIAEKLINLISQHDVAVGCVAWLTNFDILKALSGCKWVNIVVQKEDFLRHDPNGVSSNDYEKWKKSLHASYAALTGKKTSVTKLLHLDSLDELEQNPHFNSRLFQCCVRLNSEWTHYNETIRCLGYASDPMKKTTPKMHHKFLVLGSLNKDLDIIPEVVWTGSFNFSKNATNSRENVVIIKDKDIVHSYLSEWAQVWAMSEKLDWSSPEPVKAQLYVGS